MESCGVSSVATSAESTTSSCDGIAGDEVGDGGTTSAYVKTKGTKKVVKANGKAGTNNATNAVDEAEANEEEEYGDVVFL